MNVQEFLNEHHVRYRPVLHRATFSAQRMADTLHVPGDHVAKTVILKVDGSYVLALLQATQYVDISFFKATLRAESVELATETELAEIFEDCEIGAIPPFGSRYGMETIVDESLTHDHLIVFEGNSHEESICMNYEDFEELERPQVAHFSRHV